MTHRNAAVLFVIAALHLLQPHAAASERKTLTANGEGRVDVTPDSVRILVGVETLEPTLPQARARNTSVFGAIVAAVGRAGVPGVLIKSNRVEVTLVNEDRHPNDRLPKTLPKVVGYRIYNSITVRAVERDPAKLSRYGSLLLDKAVAAGANRVEEVEFLAEDSRWAYKKALLAAVDDARSNAAAMAKQAGVTLQNVVTMSPQWGSYYPKLSSSSGASYAYSQRRSYTNDSELRASEGSMAVAAGRFIVKASVSLVYELK